MDFTAILAVDEKLGIGKDGGIPWKIPEDFKHFASTTTKTKEEGKRNCVIMGRKTWLSLPKQPLKGRMNIVVSSQFKETEDGGQFTVCPSLGAALEVAKQAGDVERVFVIGGKNLYEESFRNPHCKQIIVTYIKKDYECDVKIDDLPDMSFALTETITLTKEADILFFRQMDKHRKRVFKGIRAQYE